jgi:hypothetical protein
MMLYDKLQSGDGIYWGAGTSVPPGTSEDRFEGAASGQVNKAR